MAITLRKPTHALSYVGTQNGGDHDLEIRGEIVRRNDTLVTIKVTRVKGAITGMYYPHLNGRTIDLPSIICHLF